MPPGVTLTMLAAGMVPMKSVLTISSSVEFPSEMLKVVHRPAMGQNATLQVPPPIPVQFGFDIQGVVSSSHRPQSGPMQTRPLPLVSNFGFVASAKRGDLNPLATGKPAPSTVVAAASAGVIITMLPDSAHPVTPEILDEMTVVTRVSSIPIPPSSALR